jgi:hypothetical protein
MYITKDYQQLHTMHLVPKLTMTSNSNSKWSVVLSEQQLVEVLILVAHNKVYYVQTVKGTTMWTMMRQHTHE